MFDLRSINGVRADRILVLLLVVLAGCSGGLTRSLAPEPDAPAGTTARDGPGFHAVTAPEVSASKNLPPLATILDPDPDWVFQPYLDIPVTIRWTGEDPDGHVREYRYRLFGPHNPDFPGITNFLSFIFLDPDSVLSFYSPDFPGWERVRVRKGAPAASVTYPNLNPQNDYAFAVVAVDNRGDHDPNLTRTRNLLGFGTSLSPGLALADPGHRKGSPDAPR